MVRKVCPKCAKVKSMTSHHIFPERFYGKSKENRVELCRECHDQLERFIPIHEKQSDEFYVMIVRFFLGKFK